MSTFDENYPHLGGDDPVWLEPEAGIYHPASMLMPMMPGEDLTQLGNSIQSHGLREPIILLNGLILDGRNRYRYLSGIGKTIDAARQMKTVDGRPAIIDVEMSDGDAVRYVLDRNLIRRHLTADQKREVNDKLRLTFGVNQRGVNQHTATSKEEASNDASSPLTQQERAKMLGVGRATIQRWDKLNAAEAAKAKAEGREYRPVADRDRMAEEAAPQPKPKPKPEPRRKADPKPRPRPEPEPEPIQHRTPEPTSTTFNMALEQMQGAFRLFATCWSREPEAARERARSEAERFFSSLP